jgi:peptidoglycan/xylan/chitin deacetylase (PgdA/CDA1 family)
MGIHKSGVVTRGAAVAVLALTTASCASADGAAVDEATADEGTAASSSEPLVVDDYFLDGTTLPNKVLALTFDDGPSDQTEAIVDYLNAEGIHGTFFINGTHVTGTDAHGAISSSPEWYQHPGWAPLDKTARNARIAKMRTLLTKMAKGGHMIGNHTQDHVDLTQDSPQTGFPPYTPAQILAEVTTTDALIVAANHAAGVSNPFLFRAPYGDWNQVTFDALENTGMRKYVGPIVWDAGGEPAVVADWACWSGVSYTFDPADFAPIPGLASPSPGPLAVDVPVLSPLQCGQRYINEIMNGETVKGVDASGRAATVKLRAWKRGIVLMHDQEYWDSAGERFVYGQTLTMLKYVVPILKKAGYTFVRADKVPLIEACIKDPSGCDMQDPPANKTRGDGP